jgi:hydrogenase maturation protease
VASEPARLLVVGLGNPLMGDDGVGHDVVKGLLRLASIPGVRVEALAGDVLGLAELWAGEPDVWLVDAVNGGRREGRIRVLGHRELLDLPTEGLSVHQLSLASGLKWLLHGRPEMAAIRFRLYGIEIGPVRPEEGLSRAAEEAASALVETLHAAAWHRFDSTRTASAQGSSGSG